MSLLLCIHSYPGANEILARHWPHFLTAEADEIVGIGTTDHGCRFPDGIRSVEIGENKYMDGKHLPQRLLDTIKFCLTTQHQWFCIAEYDVLFFKPVPKVMNNEDCPVAGHLAGGRVFGSQPAFFLHNPWFLTRESASRILSAGRGLIQTPYVAYGTPESSPDVFFAWCCEQADLPVHFNLMTEFSRNSLDCAGDLEAARAARRAGVDIIHGVKTLEEYNYILN